MRNVMYQIVQLVLLVVVLLPSTLAAQNSPTDLLAYTTEVNGITQLMLYDTATKQSKVVVENIYSFDFHSNGKVAYTVKRQNTTTLYILDALSLNSNPISISQLSNPNDFTHYNGVSMVNI